MKKNINIALAVFVLVSSVSCNASGPAAPDGPALPEFPPFEGTHGSLIDATNTGVPVGHSLVDWASNVTVTEAWIAASNGGSRIIENRNFTSGATLTIRTGDVTVRYCKFNGTSRILLPDAVTGILVRDCEMDGNHENRGSLQAIKNDSAALHLLRVRIHRWPRALTVIRGDTTVENCYLHDLTCDDSGAHIENIYVAGGARQRYLGNKILSNAVRTDPAIVDLNISACLALYNQGGGLPDLDTILVEDNWIDGDSSYAMYGGAIATKTGAFAKNLIVRGNTFGRQYQRRCGLFGPITAYGDTEPGNLWENNRWGPRGPYWVSGDPEEGDPVLP